MQLEIVMPRLSDSMETGTIVRWLVTEGQPVSRGEPIVEIETDKATMEYEAESDGVIVRLLLAEGESAVLGAAIAVIESDSDRQGVTVSAPPPPVRPLWARRPTARRASMRLPSRGGSHASLESISQAFEAADRMGASQRATWSWLRGWKPIPERSVAAVRRT